MASLGKNLDVMVQVNRINKQLLSVVGKCQGPVEQTLLTQASLIGAEIKSVAPVDDESETPGAAKDSVRVEVGEPTAKKAYVVRIKAGGVKTRKKGAAGEYDYVRGTEFGTQKSAAHPFFFPIWRARRKDVRTANRLSLKNSVKGVFK
jgi:hypothetical protein